MATQTITVSDLSGLPVDEAVEVFVEHPDYPGVAKLDAAPGEVDPEKLKALSVVTVTVGRGKPVTLSVTEFNKLFKNGQVPADVLKVAAASGRTATTRRARKSTGSAAKSTASDSGAIREWGLANGWELSERGPLPKALKDAYAARS